MKVYSCVYRRGDFPPLVGVCGCLGRIFYTSRFLSKNSFTRWCSLSRSLSFSIFPSFFCPGRWPAGLFMAPGSYHTLIINRSSFPLFSNFNSTVVKNWLPSENSFSKSNVLCCVYTWLTSTIRTAKKPGKRFIDSGWNKLKSNLEHFVKSIMRATEQPGSQCCLSM